MPHVEQAHAAAIPCASSGSTRRARKDPVIIAAVALIGGQLCWKAYLLSHFYFRQDDFQLMDQALSRDLSLSYLFTINGGHMRPGGQFITWIMVRVSLYNWSLACIITIALLAAASLAMLRLLLLLFGRRPAILIPLVIFLFTPLTLPGLSFWATTMLWLPPTLTTLMALDAHVRHVRSGHIGYAIAAAAWLATGMLFDEQSVLVPALAFALTSAYFVPGSWLQAARQALRRYWRAWAMYAALTVGYVVLFLIQLRTSPQRPISPGRLSSVLTLASTMLRVSFIPAAFGGPWHWFVPGVDYGYTVETPGVTQLTWLLAALIVAVSLWYRRHALRAWLILAGWFVLADFLPVMISRLTEISATILGEDLHYLADSAPILGICLGLAFWPVVGEEQPYRAARPAWVPVAAAELTLVGGFFMGSLWSGAAYLNETSSASTRSYIATARSALARAKPGTVIVSGTTPPIVMYAGYLGRAAQTSPVLGPLAPQSSRIRFVTTPKGVIRNLMIFDSKGRLRPALDVGATSVSPAGGTGCWPVFPTTTRIPLSASLFSYGWIAQLRYSGPATRMRLQFGSAVREVALPAGRGDIYVPLTGKGAAVLVRRLSPGPSACISSLTVGLMYAARPPAIPSGAVAARGLVSVPGRGSRTEPKP